ncbi:MAG: hypothetical protein WC254_03230 [Candidatus Woesearchaeota archaeon]|jgi:hypothetical protein
MSYKSYFGYTAMVIGLSTMGYSSCKVTAPVLINDAIHIVSETRHFPSIRLEERVFQDADLATVAVGSLVLMIGLATVGYKKNESK